MASFSRGDVVHTIIGSRMNVFVTVIEGISRIFFEWTAQSPGEYHIFKIADGTTEFGFHDGALKTAARLHAANN